MGEKILYIVDRLYPTHDIKIKEVFQNILPKLGYDIRLIFKSEQKIVEYNSVILYYVKKNSNLLKKIKYLLIPQKILRKPYNRYVLKNIRELCPKYVIVRNDIYLCEFLIKKNIKCFVILEKTWANEKFSLKNLEIEKINILCLPISIINLFFENKSLEYSLKNCDLSILMSEEMKKHYKSIFKKINENNLLVSPMGVKPHNHIIDHINKKIDIVYIGELHDSRNPNFIFLVLRQLINRNKEIKMVLIGAKNELEKDKLQKNAKMLGIPDKNIDIINWTDEDNMIKYLLDSKLGLSPIPPNYTFKLSSPTKVMEYLNFEIPVICNNEIRDQREIIERSKCGLAVKYDINSFVNAIQYFLTLSPESLDVVGKKGRKFIEKTRSYEKIANDIFIKLHNLLT